MMADSNVMEMHKVSEVNRRNVVIPIFVMGLVRSFQF